MKKKNKRTIVCTAVLAISLAGFVACEGPTGPQGLQGEQGSQGPEGTANVIYSEWIDVEWNGYDAEGSAYKRMDIIEPRITEEFMHRGTVLMYLQSLGAVFALPFTDVTGVEFSFFMRPAEYSAPVPGPFPEEPGLSLSYQSEVGVIFVGDPPRIRYVLIPGGMPAAQMASGVWDDYEAVAAHFGIPD